MQRYRESQLEADVRYNLGSNASGRLSLFCLAFFLPDYNFSDGQTHCYYHT